MRCPTCGVAYDAPTRFCPTDGASLVADPAPVSPPSPSSPARPFVLGVLSAAAVGLLAVGAFWLGANRAPTAEVVDLPPAAQAEPFGTPSAIQPAIQRAELDEVRQAAETAVAAANDAKVSADAAAMSAEMEVDDAQAFGDTGSTAIMGGLFDVPGNATRRVAALRRAGFEAYASPEDIFQGYDGGRTIVTLGPYTRAEARRLLPAVRRVVPDAFTKVLVLR